MAKPFTVAAKMYFGLKPGQTLSEFANECRALTLKDQEDLAPGLEAAIGESVSVSKPSGA